MKSVVFAMLAIQLMANFAPWGENGLFPRPYLGEHHEHLPYNFNFNTNALPFKPHHLELPRREHRGRHQSSSSRHSHTKNQIQKADPCADPANKDAPFCQKPVFTRVGQKIPIFWKNRNIAVSPINNIVGGSIHLRTYNEASDDQKWIFTPVSEYTYNNQYFITNAATKLALTANGYSSPLILQDKINALNQIFYVRPQTDGSFFISAYGSDLYMDAQETDSGSLPVLIIRNYEGDITQKWLLN